MHSALLAITLAVAGCSQSNAMEGSLTWTTAELQRQQQEAGRLKDEVARLTAENERLRQTEEGLWAGAVSADTNDDLDAARKLYRDYAARFPTSARGPVLSTVLAKLDDRRCAKLATDLGARLNSTDRDSVDGVAHSILDGADLREACRSKESLARLHALEQVAKDTMTRWPTRMTLAEYAARHIELKGKRALVSGKLLVADYFNWGYTNRTRLRSFRIRDDATLDTLAVYCERGPRCDDLLARALRDREVSGEWVIENSVRYYEPEGSDMGLLVLGGEP